jgi:uncharacterized ParB-like nuclease family protein
LLKNELLQESHILNSSFVKLQEADMNETPTPVPHKADHIVAITAIIATTITLLTCIAGCSIVLIALAEKIP